MDIKKLSYWLNKWMVLHHEYDMAQSMKVVSKPTWYDDTKRIPTSWKISNLKLQEIILFLEFLTTDQIVIENLKYHCTEWCKYIELSLASPILESQNNYFLQSDKHLQAINNIVNGNIPLVTIQQQQEINKTFDLINQNIANNTSIEEFDISVDMDVNIDPKLDTKNPQNVKLDYSTLLVGKPVHVIQNYEHAAAAAPGRDEKMDNTLNNKNNLENSDIEQLLGIIDSQLNDNSISIEEREENIALQLHHFVRGCGEKTIKFYEGRKNLDSINRSKLAKQECIKKDSVLERILTYTNQIINEHRQDVKNYNTAPWWKWISKPTINTSITDAYFNDNNNNTDLDDDPIINTNNNNNDSNDKALHVRPVNEKLTNNINSYMKQVNEKMSDSSYVPSNPIEQQIKNIGDEKVNTAFSALAAWISTASYTSVSGLVEAFKSASIKGFPQIAYDSAIQVIDNLHEHMTTSFILNCLPYLYYIPQAGIATTEAISLLHSLCNVFKTTIEEKTKEQNPFMEYIYTQIDVALDEEKNNIQDATVGGFEKIKRSTTGFLKKQFLSSEGLIGSVIKSCIQKVSSGTNNVIELSKYMKTASYVALYGSIVINGGYYLYKTMSVSAFIGLRDHIPTYGLTIIIILKAISIYLKSNPENAFFNKYAKLWIPIINIWLNCSDPLLLASSEVLSKFGPELATTLKDVNIDFSKLSKLKSEYMSNISKDSDSNIKENDQQNAAKKIAKELGKGTINLAKYAVKYGIEAGKMTPKAAHKILKIVLKTVINVIPEDLNAINPYAIRLNQTEIDRYNIILFHTMLDDKSATTNGQLATEVFYQFTFKTSNDIDERLKKLYDINSYSWQNGQFTNMNKIYKQDMENIKDKQMF